MFDGAYPPGVEGWMIDRYFGEDEDGEYRACENCQHYQECPAGWICGVLEVEYENDHGTEGLKALSCDDYIRLFSKDPDEYCDDWEEE